jgi:uncharacterized protein (TIGR01777 family)
MKVLICGGGGFIGQRLTSYFLSQGMEVVILDRNRSRVTSHSLQSHVVDLLTPGLYQQEWFGNVDAVINLSGKDIFTLWTENNRTAIWKSRITVNKYLLDFIAELPQKPKTFVSASAVGYYGDKGDTEIDENASKGKGFLSDVCTAWEREARRAETLGMRSVQIRTAPVLDTRGGIMGQLMKSMKFGFTFRFGSGQNWFPWIHMDDLIRVYHSVVVDERLSGPVNACSPHPVSFSEFLNELTGFKKAVIIPFPVWILKLIIQETADVISFSQRMIPAKLQNAGFLFSYPKLRDALKVIFSRAG